VWGGGGGEGSGHHLCGHRPDWGAVLSENLSGGVAHGLSPDRGFREGR
jgi:hypothetical protein